MVLCLGISMACAETVEFEYYALTSGVKMIGAKAQKKRFRAAVLCQANQPYTL